MPCGWRQGGRERTSHESGSMGKISGYESIPTRLTAVVRIRRNIARIDENTAPSPPKSHCCDYQGVKVLVPCIVGGLVWCGSA